MKQPFFEWVLIAALITGVSGCGVLPQLGARQEASSRQRPLSAVSEPARAVIEELTAQGTIKRIEEEQTDGRVVYDVEATVGEKDFGSAAGLSAARQVEGSKTYYEVQGQKKARTVALKLTETGRIVEKERL